MNKFIYPLASVVFTALIACNKSDGNKAVIATQTDAHTTSNTERYVAEDGSSALVTIVQGDESSISIRSNNKTISAPEKSEGVYSNYDFEIVKRNDSVIISQGNNIISLKKARGQ